MLESEMFFGGSHRLMRVLILTLVGYVALLVMLRLSRKRSLAKMNVFDFVYVVIIGELIAITIMDENVALLDGLAATALLIVLQVVLSWLTTRSKRLERVINGEPTLLMRHGHFLHDAMHRERTTVREILSAIRAEGVADLEKVEAVVLETNGSLSVIHSGAFSRSSALRDVPEAGHGGDRTERRTALHERRSPGARPKGAFR